MASLSRGILRELIKIDDKPPSDFPSPIVQIINLKPIASQNGKDRMRAVLSDSEHYVQGMLASQTMNEQLNTNVIIKINNFMVNIVGNRKVVILLSIDVLSTSSERIGNPVPLETTLPPGYVPKLAGNPQPLYNSTNHAFFGSQNTTSYAPPPPGATAAAYAASPPPAASTNNNAYGHQQSSSNNPYGRGGGSSSQSSPAASARLPIARTTTDTNSQMITKIASLSMYTQRFTLQARVTSKSDIRTWSNSKGEGSLFSIDLLDDSMMDVRATFFKEAVDKYYNIIEVGKVYRITGGRIKLANPKWNTCQCLYEITYDLHSEVHQVDDDGTIQSAHYEFVKLAALEQTPPGTTADVVCIVKHVSDAVNIISKKTGQELTKCDLTLVDDSGVEITLTMWGEHAKTAPTEFAGHPVVAFRRARVGDFGGRSLNFGAGADVNPPVELANQLQAWWNSVGQNAGAARSLSTVGGRVDAFSDRKLISSIAEEHMGHSDKPDWLTFKGVITFLKKDKEGGAWYPACPNPNEPCKNRFKCTQTTDGQWFCAKCENTYPNPVRRWIFSGVIEDSSSSTWVSFFNEQAEMLVNATADDVHQRAFGEAGNDLDFYESIFTRPAFTEWVFKCKVKSEIHNEEAKVKTQVYSLAPVDYIQESKELLAAIEQF